MILDETKNMVVVPPEFGVGAFHPHPYPPDNVRIYEEWYYDTLRPSDSRDRIYLPVFWTGYYCRHKYGKDFLALHRLQQYLDTLDKTKRYYTIVQYDDGILNYLEGLDLRVYSMSGKPMDYPLPLLCQLHKYQFTVERDILVSFVGRITHPVRKILIDELGGSDTCYVTDKPHSLEEYCRILARSRFVLCPEGYGPTSFRIVEAMQYGAVPIYISDRMIEGHSYSLPGGMMPSNIFTEQPHLVRPTMHMVCKQMAVMIVEVTERMHANFEKYYTFEGSKKLMLEDLVIESLNLSKICDPS